MEAHINPSDLSQLWVNLGGLKCLHLTSADPNMLQMTLLDWLAVSRDDRLVGFLARVDETKEGVNRIATITRATVDANRERAAEIKATGSKPTKGEQKRHKRDNTAIERAAITGMPRPPTRKVIQSPGCEHVEAQPSLVAPPSHRLNGDFADAIRALRQD